MDLKEQIINKYIETKQIKSLTNSLLHSNEFKQEEYQPMFIEAFDTVIQNYIDSKKPMEAKSILNSISTFNELNPNELYAEKLNKLFGHGIAIAQLIDEEYYDGDDRKDSFNNNVKSDAAAIQQYRETIPNTSENLAARFYIDNRRKYYINNDHVENAIRLAQNQAYIESLTPDFDKDAFNYLLDKRREYLKEPAQESVKKANIITAMLLINCGNDSYEKTIALSLLPQMRQHCINVNLPDSADYLLNLEIEQSQKMNIPLIPEQELVLHNDRIAIAKLLHNNGETEKAITKLKSSIEETEIVSDVFDMTWNALSAIRDYFIQNEKFEEAKELIKWQVNFCLRGHNNDTPEKEAVIAKHQSNAVEKSFEMAKKYYDEKDDLDSSLTELSYALSNTVADSDQETEIMNYVCGIIDDYINENVDIARHVYMNIHSNTDPNHALGTQGIKIAKAYEDAGRFPPAFEFAQLGYFDCNYGSPEQVKAGEYMHRLIDEMLTKYQDPKFAEQFIIGAVKSLNTNPNKSKDIPEEKTGLNRKKLQENEKSVIRLHIDQKELFDVVKYAINGLSGDTYTLETKISNNILLTLLDDLKEKKQASGIEYLFSMCSENSKTTIFSRYQELPELLLEQEKYPEAMEYAKKAYKHSACSNKQSPWDVINTVREHYETSQDEKEVASKILEWQKINVCRDNHKEDIKRITQEKNKQNEKLKEMKNSVFNILENFSTDAETTTPQTDKLDL